MVLVIADASCYWPALAGMHTSGAKERLLVLIVQAGTQEEFM